MEYRQILIKLETGITEYDVERIVNLLTGIKGISGAYYGSTLKERLDGIRDCCQDIIASIDDQDWDY